MPEKLRFTKMHGCGNDFIVTHEVDPAAVDALARATPALCDRRTGVGADGIILVLPADNADFTMRILNADGSEAEMCGNGIRCMAAYVNDHGLSAKDRLRIQTKAGLIETERRGGLVRVAMGRPVLEAGKIPVAEREGTVIDRALDVSGRRFAVTAVSMGNPHAVVFDEPLDDDTVLGWGAKLEAHPFFPRHANVEFVYVLSPSEIRVRVFERGVGETLACGTGACAAVVAGILKKLLASNVTVHLRGGDLQIEWSGDPAHPVHLSGPARTVFSGAVAVQMAGPGREC
jgi:diaminopimelate epimerase